MRLSYSASLVVAVVLAASSPARAQAPTDRLTVFLDCRTGGCDRNFLIEELPFVVWTQQPLDALVHVLVTGLETGGGGTQYTLALIGQQRFAPRTDTVRTTIPPNTTADARRREIARVIKLGLVPYVLQTGIAARFALEYEAPEDEAVGTAGLNDRWNFWTYRISTSGSGEAESRYREYSIDGSLEANRVTEKWKVNIEAQYEYESGKFEEDSVVEKFLLREASLEAGVIRSLTDHWSVGAGTEVSTTEFRNERLAFGLDVGAEFNFFPWKEATRRQLIARAAVGARYFDYRDSTIYGEVSELRPIVRAEIAMEASQPWGSVFAGLEHSRYLHDTDFYSIGLDGNINVRISRGFSVNFGVNAEKVNDQIGLPAGGATPAQILLRQRELATAYRIGGHAGITFRFGSIFNTIVNPRFDGF